MSFDLISRSAEALQRLKPQELRALWLKAQGHSYNDIGAITGWSYTKVNRCLTEGRRSFLERYAGIESGAECERWMPVISAMVDGEATPEQILELRPHLRNCPGCRATLKALHDSSAPLSAVLPIPLAVAAAGGGDHIANLLMRAYEAVAGGFHDRAVYSATKAQAAIEAVAGGKLAVVAASAAAVAGGGYATVEHTVRHEHANRVSKTAQRADAKPAKKQRAVTGIRTIAARTRLQHGPAEAPPQRLTEFGQASTSTRLAKQNEFGATRTKPAVRAISATVRQPTYSQALAPKPKPAPEFSSADGGNEFGP